MLEHYRRYLEACGRARPTVERYVGTVGLFAVFVAPLELAAVTAVDVEEFLSTRRNLKTRHAYRSDLAMFYRWAQRRCGWTHNPLDDVDPIRVPKTLPRPLPDGAVGRLLAVGPLRTRRAVGLGVFAGLRNAETAALDAVDVSLHHGELVVRDGKGAKDRVVPIHPMLAELLDGIAPRGPVVVGRHGGPVTPDTVGDIVRRHFRACGIVATPHQLRHTFGTEMARAAGGNLVVVARTMGHANIATTMGYTGWQPEARPIIAAMFGDAA